MLLDGSVVVEEGSPELLHGDNIWFTTCDRSATLEEDGHFEICLSGFHDRKLVFDRLNGNFKVTMFPEQLTSEHHLMKVEAVVYLQEFDEVGKESLLLTIRPHTNEIFASSRYMLSVDETRRFGNFNDQRSIQMKEVGRLNMVQTPQNWKNLEHVKLELMFG